MSHVHFIFSFILGLWFPLSRSQNHCCNSRHHVFIPGMQKEEERKAKGYSGCVNPFLKSFPESSTQMFSIYCLWEMACISGHKFKQTLSDSEGQGSLACYSPWGHKESTQLNSNNLQRTLGNVDFFQLVCCHLTKNKVRSLRKVGIDIAWATRRICLLLSMVVCVLDIFPSCENHTDPLRPGSNVSLP